MQPKDDRVSKAYSVLHHSIRFGIFTEEDLIIVMCYFVFWFIVHLPFLAITTPLAAVLSFWVRKRFRSWATFIWVLSGRGARKYGVPDYCWRYSVRRGQGTMSLIRICKNRLDEDVGGHPNAHNQSN